jgi:phospholipid transport system substrate-binding protein
MKANLIAIFLILFTSASMTAAATPYKPYYPGAHYNTQPQATAETPATILKAGITKLTAFIKSGKATNNAQAMHYLQTEIMPYFDFAYMTRWAAGPAWRHMETSQRTRMQTELTEAFLTTLAQKLTTYSNQQIRYFTPRGRSGDEVMVSAWIMQPNGPPTKLDFRFYKSKQGWKIFDVKAGGNSAVVYYRNQFKNLFRYPNQARYQH